MATGIDRSPTGSGGPPMDISGAVTGALIGHVQRHFGEAAVQRMLEAAGEPRSAAELVDPTTWSSHSAAIALFAAAADVTSDPSIGWRVGEAIVHRHDAVATPHLLRSLGSPTELLQNIAGTFGALVAVTTLEPVEVGYAHAVVQARTPPAIGRHRCLCDLTKGLLSQIPALYGLAPANLQEPECQVTGGRSCTYRLTWEDYQWSGAVDQRSRLYERPIGQAEQIRQLQVTEATAPPPRTDTTAGSARSAPAEATNRPAPGTPTSTGADSDSAAALRMQIDHLTNQLRSVYATASDLFSRQDIDDILARITDRAAHAVRAERYLLTVRIAPDQPKRLHHQGFSDAEASVLADTLLSNQPDDQDGSWLIVDIASATRFYGRLAAVVPNGGSFTKDERNMLALYADYAAAALDTVTALDEARQSDTTARSLLNFSRRLAEAASPHDIARALANAAMQVLRANRSAVWLWDPAQECLRHSAGSPPDSVPMAARGAPWPVGEPTADRLVLYRSDSAVIDQMRRDGVPVLVCHADSEHLPDPLFSQGGFQTAVVAALRTGEEFLGLVTAEYDDPTAVPRSQGLDPGQRLWGLADQAATAVVNVRLLEQISHLAWHDDLTGLPNRRLLQDRANQELLRSRRTGEPLCVFFLDLDHFKHVNDTLGHAAGDELIVEVAGRLTRTVRDQDTVARLGGDELAVLLPNLGAGPAAAQLAQRTLDALHAPYVIAGHELHASVSIGIAVAPDHGDTWDQLLSAADEAMYRSKRLGRDTYQLYEPGHGQSPDRQLHADLTHAIERSQLFLVYLPIVNLVSGHVVGVEALVRWAHPTLGTLMPPQFLPMADELNLVPAVDQWVLATACRQVRAWDIDDFRLVVNASAQDLASDAYVEAAIATLVETAFDPQLLEIDVADTVVMEKARHNIERLRRVGVRFAIDNFGAGMAPLVGMADLPVSTLKVDPSFVRVLTATSTNDSMVSAIASMARELQVDCLAEGVETADQFRILTRRGYQSAQGYFFSRPLPADGLRQLLHRPGALATAGRPSAPRPDTGATV